MKIGAFSKIGWISDLEFVQDNDCGGYIIQGSSIGVYNFQSNFVYSVTDIIAFGRNGMDFHLNCKHQKDCKVSVSEWAPKVDILKSNYFDELNKKGEFCMTIKQIELYLNN